MRKVKVYVVVLRPRIVGRGIGRGQDAVSSKRETRAETSDKQIMP
jgi:hypothetical protein